MPSGALSSQGPKIVLDFRSIQRYNRYGPISTPKSQGAVRVIKKEYLFAGLSILFWGSTAAVSSLMMDSLSSMALVFYNGLTATVFLFLVNLFTGRLKLLRSISPKEWLKLSLLGLVGMFCVSFFLYCGLARLKAQQAYIINYLWPILIVLFSWPLLGQKMTNRKAIALLVSFLGVAIVASEGDFSGLGQTDLVGVLACVAAACSYAIFSVLNIKVTCDKFVAMLIYYMATMAAGLLFLLIREPIPVLTVPQWGGILWLGVLTNGLAYTTWALAMDIGDTAKLSNLAYLTPFVSLIYIYVLLHEPITWSSYAGLFFILSGVVIQLSGDRSSHSHARSPRFHSR